LAIQLTVTVSVTMVQVGIVWMRVPHRFVAMPVRMRLGHETFVRVLVMFVVTVNMIVLQLLVVVRMLMAFCKMQPKTHGHKNTGTNELP
jgi:predicted metal-dependent hydrolase